MRQFLKYVLATIVGLGLFAFLSIFILIGIGAASSSSEPAKVKDKSVLRLSFDGAIGEKGQDNPFAKFGGGEDKLSLDKVRKAIAKAKDDDNIKGILIDARFVRTGMGTAEEVRNALLDFKKGGKFIYAYGDVMTEGAYYLASVAKPIYVAPEGGIEFNGLGTNIAFLKGMFSKLEIQPEIFRVGQYKSAVEPFILDKMSDANREQTTSFLNSIYGHMIKQVAASRGLSEQAVRLVSDSFKVRTAEDAVKFKLADEVAYFDQVEDKIRKTAGIEAKDKIHYVSLEKYAKTVKSDDKEKSGDKIALVVAEGGISTGKTQDGIGSDDLAPLIRKVRMDDDVKAVVLRINSPGGDALASDIIWREVELLKAKKPVVVSMGDVAASGGYYIAMGANKIYAEPTTITGSIGVFGMFFNSQQFWNNKTGITFDGVKTGKFSDWPNATRAFTDFERKVMQQYVDNIYKTFTAKAAQGRKMDVERLRSLASGRVWSGLEAKANGLIDEIGSLDDAVAAAAKLAKLGDDYKLQRMPREKDFFETIMAEFDDSKEDEEARLLVKLLGPEQAKLVQQYAEIRQMTGIQARLPWEVEFR